MQVYHFKCRACSYEAKLPLGSSDLDQILTDANADYADYRLFICKNESKFVHADIHDKTFVGKCPSDGSELEEIKDLSTLRCPRCNSDNLVTEVTDVMEGST